MKNYLNMSNEQIENFGREIEFIYTETKAKLGKGDLDHILKMKELSNSLEIGGRALIHLSKDPLSWMSGVILLGYHFLLEFTELGHNILHAQYDDIPGNMTVNSKTWKWDSTMDEKDWKFEHHVVHHPFTNIVGKDNDFGFLVYRVNDAQKWKLYHFFQVPMLLSMPLINSFYFPWYVSTSRALAESREVLTWETYLPSIKKIGTHFLKNYILFPFLPGASYLKVAAGNFFAKLFQNTYLEMILAISHLHKDAYIFEDTDNETKGEFYLRQVLATVNFDSPSPYDIVYGAINLHIEHHLFPDLPPNRLREVAPKVKAVCEKYRVPYRSGQFLSQFMGVIENALLRSLPLKPEENGDVWKLIQNPIELIDRILDGAKSLGEIFSTNDYSLFSQAEIVHCRTEIGGDAKSFTIQIPNDWDPASWKAGHYISIQLSIDGKKYIRQYSLTHPSLTSEYLHVTVKRIKDGKVSNYINDNWNKGNRVTIIGKPKGEFVLTTTNSKILFLAAGAGITPIISMIRKADYDGNLSKCKLLYFNQSPERAIFLSELQELQSNGLDCNFYFDTAIAPFKQGLIANSLLAEEVKDLKERKIYLCAPKGFIEKTKEILNELKFEKSNLFLETFIPPSLSIDPSRTNIFHTVKLIKSRKEIRINENTNLLDAIETAGIPVTSGCRQGMCKSCQVVKVSGCTHNEVYPISQRKRITTCNSLPRSDIELDI